MRDFNSFPASDPEAVLKHRLENRGWRGNKSSNMSYIDIIGILWDNKGLNKYAFVTHKYPCLLAVL